MVQPNSLKVKETNTGGQLHQPAMPSAAAPKPTDNRALSGSLRPRDQSHPLVFASDRMAQLARQDSNLMRQAAAKAGAQMQGRGLLSSSMAIGAERDARMRAAMPLALSDAEQANRAALQGREMDFKAEQDALRRQHATQMQEGDIGGKLALLERGAELRQDAVRTEHDFRERMARLQDETARYGIDVRKEIADLNSRVQLYGINRSFMASLLESAMGPISSAMSTGEYGASEIAGLARGTLASLRHIMDVVGGILGERK